MSVCVCGHPKEYHDSPGNRINGGCAGLVGYDVDHDASDCQCRMYRPVLSWPDAEGWWWWSGDSIPHLVDRCLVFYRESQDSCFQHESEEALKRKDFFPATRFVRLMEPNPFEKKA